MVILMRYHLILVICASVVVGAHAKPPVVDDAREVGAASPDALVREAQRALDSEQFADAERLLAEAARLMPGEASLPYNLGVARYRQGDYAGAAKAFTRAAELANDANLRARAAFNQGTSTYAQALKSLEGGQGGADVEEPLKESMDLVGNSLEQLKTAIEADPKDRDARANAELAHRLLKQLEAMQQQMQQQQQQQQQEQNKEQSDEQSQSEHDQQQQSTSDDQQEQEQKQQQQQEQQSQEQGDENGEPQRQEQQQEQEQQGEEEQQPQQQPQSADEQQEQDESEAGEELQERQGQPREGAMTREQAERLLQMVRDKQRERRAVLAAQRASSHKPSARDW
jgi:Ca-activated chloride channel family protein